MRANLERKATSVAWHGRRQIDDAHLFGFSGRAVDIDPRD
jgi:hypothetical protein